MGQGCGISVSPPAKKGGGGGGGEVVIDKGLGIFNLLYMYMYMHNVSVGGFC